MPGQSETKETHSSRPSVIQCVRTPSIEETSAEEVIDVDSSPFPHSVRKRAVAKKSTSKCRSVARKSTGGRSKNRKIIPLEIVVSGSSDSEWSDDDCISHGDEVDVNKISCPMMFEGTRMRVSIATLSQVSVNIFSYVHTNLIHFRNCDLHLFSHILFSIPIYTQLWN